MNFVKLLHCINQSLLLLQITWKSPNIDDLDFYILTKFFKKL